MSNTYSVKMSSLQTHLFVPDIRTHFIGTEIVHNVKKFQCALKAFVSTDFRDLFLT